MGTLGTIRGQIHCQLVDAHEPQPVLGPQLAQKFRLPLASAVGFKPHLLPVALIFAGYADSFAHGTIKLLDQGPYLRLVEHRPAAELGTDLALHHQIAVTANRGGGLHIGRQSQAEVGGRLGAH